eukprot:82726-Pelagomonas_calceolata.AAC.2
MDAWKDMRLPKGDDGEYSYLKPFITNYLPLTSKTMEQGNGRDYWSVDRSGLKHQHQSSDK